MSARRNGIPRLDSRTMREPYGRTGILKPFLMVDSTSGAVD
jgi:hypothetical protein